MRRQPSSPDVDHKLAAAIRDLYDDVEPSAQTVRQLTAGSRGRRGIVVLASGALTTAVAAGLLLLLWLPSPELAARIANEVYAQHRRQETMAFDGGSFSELAEQMPRLDFPLLPSSRLGEVSLGGAKYCSVLGRIAARIDVVTADGQHQTLYVAQGEAEWRDLPDQTVAVDSGQVALWNEAGLFYALARDR